MYRIVRNHNIGGRGAGVKYLILILMTAVFCIGSLTAYAQTMNAQTTNSTLGQGSLATNGVFDHLTTGYDLTGEHSQIDCEACHIGGVFEALSTQCESCHDGVIAVGKMTNHIETVASCDTCHSTVGFVAAAIMDHSVITSGCSACHNGISATGQHAFHISTSLNCDACHNTNSWNIGLFDHANIAGQDCISCHNGTIASGKSQLHIATSDICEACHEVSPVPWAPIASSEVDHNEVRGTCSSCHNNQSAIGKGESHIETSGECNACHSTLGWDTATIDHSRLNGRACITCHNNVTTQGKSVTHISTSDVCEACHAVSPTPWVPLVSANVDHNEVLGACASCHNGSIVPGKSPSHFNTSDNCKACHAEGPTPWTPVAAANVDHTEVNGVCSSCHNGVDAIGKSSDHIPTTDECSACHSTQQWAPAAVDHTNFINNCISCHDGASGGASGKRGNHITTTDVCDACHAKFPANWEPVAPAAVDHDQVIGLCINCHDGVIASGKGANHVRTTNVCDACHAVNPASWAPVAPQNVDHNEVVGSCIECHDGVKATGKGPGHIATSDICDACHAISPTPWTPVISTNVDHTQVVGVCSTCHDNVTAIGKGPDHIPTTGECSACHSTQQWSPAAVDHANFSNNCITCHDGNIASGKSIDHITTSAVCDACHEKFPANWAPVIPSAVDHAQVVGACITCHDNATASGKSLNHITSSDNCDKCHVAGPVPWAPVISANVDHNEVNGTCVSCHDGIIAIGKSLTHPDTSSQCERCHVTERWDLVNTVDHTQVNGRCADCHANDKSPDHPATSNVCDACHTVAPAPWSTIIDVNHNEVQGNCANAGCHANDKPGEHINATNVCEACHSTGRWEPVTVVDHLQVIGRCVACHNGSIALGQRNDHPNTTDNCANCHTTARFSPVNAVDHTQVAGTCVSCHAKSGNHPITTENCDACHSPDRWSQIRMDHNEVPSGSCSSCHNGNIAEGKDRQHCSTNQECDVCHKSTTDWDTDIGC